MILLKVTAAKNAWFFTIGFLIMSSSFKILYKMVVLVLTILCLNISDIAIVTVKNFDYRCIIHNVSKSEPISSLKNSFLEDRSFDNLWVASFELQVASWEFLFTSWKVILWVENLFCNLVTKLRVASCFVRVAILKK